MATDNPEPTLADVIALINAQNTKIDALTQQVDSMSQNPGDEPDLAQLADMSDEDLIAAGYDPASVDAAIQSAIQSGELQVEGGEGANNDGNGEGAGELAGTAIGAELAALRKEINYFKRKENREVALAAKDEEDRLLVAFDVVEQKCVALAAQNDALRTALASGSGAAVSASSEIVLLDDATGKPKTYEAIVKTEFSRLMKSGEKGMTELRAKSKAVEFAVKKHPAAYREFRSSGRAQIEFSVE